MKKALKYIIPSAIGLVAAIVIAFTRNVTKQETLNQVFAILSDAFFAPGVCITGIGLIVWAGSGGVFDMLAYGIITLFDTFRKNISGRKYKSFYEYRQAKKSENRKLGFLLAVGLAFIAVSAIFTILYFSV